MKTRLASAERFANNQKKKDAEGRSRVFHHELVVQIRSYDRLARTGHNVVRSSSNTAEPSHTCRPRYVVANRSADDNADFAVSQPGYGSAAYSSSHSAKHSSSWSPPMPQTAYRSS